MDEVLINKTPSEWKAEFDPPEWRHVAAAVLHQWVLHWHHEGAELQLSENAYLSALKAVDEGAPYLPALSPHNGKAL